MYPMRSVVVSVFLVALAAPAMATPVTININGHLTSVPGTLSSAFIVGETFTIHYSYDTTTGNAGSSSLGIYYYQSYDLDIGSGATEFTLHAPAGGVFANSIQILNNPAFDAYTVDATDNLTFTNAALFAPTYTLVQAKFQYSYFASQFSSTALLPGAPPPGGGLSFDMEFRPDPQSLDGRVFVFGTFDSVTATLPQAPAPSPATALLFAPGLLALAAQRRTARRR